MELTDEIKREAAIPLRSFQHPSHKHPLTKTIYLEDYGRCCDNDHCEYKFHKGNVLFSCTLCDFDLCERCFFLPTEATSVEAQVPEPNVQIPQDQKPNVHTIKVHKVTDENDDDESEDNDNDNDDSDENDNNENNRRYARF